MTDAALALHDVGFEQHYLEDARRWSDHLWRHYRDPASNLIAMTRLESQELPVIPRPTHDDAVPNAVGVHAANLIRLARKAGEARERERADILTAVALRTVPRAPLAHGSVLNAFDLTRNGVEVVLVGSARAAFHAAARRLPYTTTLLIDCPHAEGPTGRSPGGSHDPTCGRGRYLHLL